MNKLLLSFLTCLMISSITFSQEEIHVVLLAGQSNMAGRGVSKELDAALIKRIQDVSDRVLISTSDIEKKKPEPLSSFKKNFGPELMVGLTLAEANPEQHYLLIKKAVGGTSLYGAWSTEWTKEKAMIAERGEERQALQLYAAHIKNIHQNLEELKAENKTFKILGLLWMQGESDTNKAITATSYQNNIQNLINGYRSELKIKDLPIVIGQVNVLPRKYKIGPTQVRNAMLSVANSDKNIGIIETSTDENWSDFPKHSDNLHYNTIGQKRLGIAFAKELIKLLNK